MTTPRIDVLEIRGPREMSRPIGSKNSFHKDYGPTVSRLKELESERDALKKALTDAIPLEEMDAAVFEINRLKEMVIGLQKQDESNCLQKLDLSNEIDRLKAELEKTTRGICSMHQDPFKLLKLNMPFTDDDLKFFKKLLKDKSMWPLRTRSPELFINLIARLEAAEEYIFQFETNGPNDDNTLRARMKMQKAAGK